MILPLAAAILSVEVHGYCGNRFVAPAPPLHATDLNGLALPDVCFNNTHPHHVFVIGDWGGIRSHGKPPVPADHRGKKFPTHGRDFVVGVDDTAQMRVAKQMAKRAVSRNPDYILNVGDNFYWGGITAKCGAPTFKHIETGQWTHVFENVYKGPGIDNKQWLGVLGNHDYGGWMFTAAWDQVIGYTWTAHTGRWMTPSQYWTVNVHYMDFSIAYYFLDSNVFDTVDGDISTHNICGTAHNKPTSSCGAQGPTSLEDCSKWFAQLWSDQMEWFEKYLAASTADWQIAVSHFPPSYGKETWKYFAKRYGLDLIIAGHVHQQEVWPASSAGNFLAPTTWIVSGGGGGITSQGTPTVSGDDDQYGFMDLTLGKHVIVIEAISHGGQVRHTEHVCQRFPQLLTNHTPQPQDCIWSTTTSTTTTCTSTTTTTTRTTSSTTTLSTTTRTATSTKSQTTWTSTDTSTTTTSRTTTSRTTLTTTPEYFKLAAHTTTQDLVAVNDLVYGGNAKLTSRPSAAKAWWAPVSKRIEKNDPTVIRGSTASGADKAVTNSAANRKNDNQEAVKKSVVNTKTEFQQAGAAAARAAALQVANAASANSMESLVNSARAQKQADRSGKLDGTDAGWNPFVYT